MTNHIKTKHFTNKEIVEMFGNYINESYFKYPKILLHFNELIAKLIKDGGVRLAARFIKSKSLRFWIEE